MKKTELLNALREVTETHYLKWNLSVKGDEIRVSNNYFTKAEYFTIKRTHPDFVVCKLNYTGDTVTGLFIGDEFYSDFKEWNIESFKEIVKRIVKFSDYYI